MWINQTYLKEIQKANYGNTWEKNDNLLFSLYFLFFFINTLYVQVIIYYVKNFTLQFQRIIQKIYYRMIKILYILFTEKKIISMQKKSSTNCGTFLIKKNCILQSIPLLLMLLLSQLHPFCPSYYDFCLFVCKGNFMFLSCTVLNKGFPCLNLCKII